MSFDNLEIAIQQANAEINVVRRKAEIIVDEISQIVPVFLDEWANSIIDRSVKDHPEIVKELGAEKIGQLKKSLISVTASFPNSVKDKLTTMKWIHKLELSQDEIDANIILDHDLSKKANETLDEVLREVIGQVGALLIEYGVTKSGSEWQNKSGRLRYSYGIPDHIGFPAGIQLRDIRVNYSKVIEEYVNAIRALRTAEKEKSVAEAKSLWDQA
ncbi:MAG: hypothetical protein JEZ00_11305 [Anaerolineaceae bacterium]|nr:hypothetical protein [Anaerolineaceae bacterium]